MTTRRLVIAVMAVVMVVAATTIPVMAADEHPLTATVFVNEYISSSISDENSDGIDFGLLNDGVSHQPDEAQGEGTPAVTVTVSSETNVACDVKVKGTAFAGPGDDIPVGNAEWGATFDATGTDMTTGFVQVGSTPAGGGTVGIWHWLDVPDNQQSGSYSATFTYQVVAQ